MNGHVLPVTIDRGMCTNVVEKALAVSHLVTLTANFISSLNIQRELQLSSLSVCVRARVHVRMCARAITKATAFFACLHKVIGWSR
jgi:hypothetical protein